MGAPACRAEGLRRRKLVEAGAAVEGTAGPAGLDEGEYLIEAFFRLGPTRNNGMSVTPTDWSEIKSFADLTGRISEPWEAEVLFDMCRGYHEARLAGEDPLAMSPVEIEAESQQ